MRLSIPQDLLDHGLRTVGRAVSTRGTIPLLSGICLEAAGGRLRLRATDLERAVTIDLPADVAEPGSLVLPGRYLQELVRRMEPGTVSLSPAGPATAIRLAGGEAEWTVHGFPAEQFPREPEPGSAPAVTVAARALRRLLRETGFATAHDESRPWFTGLFLALEGERLLAMATDQAVVAYGEVEAANPAGLAFSLILPGPTAQELGRLLQNDAAGCCAIHPVQNQLCFRLEEVSLTSRLLEGPYPDFRRLMPTDYSSRFRLGRTRLLEALDRAALLAHDGELRLEGEAGALLLRARTPEVGSFAERVAAELSGPPFEVGLNVRYLLEGLRAMEGPDLLLEFAGRRSPVRFRSGPEAAGFFAVMPLITF
ncbi:MAG: DNA polymerase III subunit beta [Bacillota bacterium]